MGAAITQAQDALPAIEQQRRAVQAQLGHVKSSLGRFGRDFVANTSEMFEQVRAVPAARCRRRRRKPPGAGIFV